MEMAIHIFLLRQPQTPVLWENVQLFKPIFLIFYFFEDLFVFLDPNPDSCFFMFEI
jgi:hypothetical protein